MERKLNILIFYLFFKILYSFGFEEDVKADLYRNGRLIHSVNAKDCKTGAIFNSENYFDCICLTGLWAFYDSYCEKPLFLIAGEKFCYNLGKDKFIKNAFLLSSSSNINDSTIFSVGENLEYISDGKSFKEKEDGFNHFLTFNYLKGKQLFDSIIVTKGRLMQLKDGSYCLKESKRMFCYYKNKEMNIVYPICNYKLKELIVSGHKGNCFTIFEPNDPDTCLNVDPYTKSEFNPYFQDLEDNKTLSKSRIKRETETKSLINEINEDVAIKQSFEKQSDEIISSHISDYIQRHVSSLINAKPGEDWKEAHHPKFPVFKLLEISRKIFEKTCTSLKPHFLKLAVEVFIQIQTRTYHIKEPYIQYASFLRIKSALNRCVSNSKPHNFINNEKNDKIDNCRNGQASQATPFVDIGDGKPFIELNITDKIKTKGYEPIIETVWKIFHNAHLYCFEYFEDYYNDHHAFTVTMTQLFSNQIQDLWRNRTYEKNPYGGLLGSIEILGNNLDYCLAASRSGDDTNYPWFLSRPEKDESNKWKKRKRRAANDLSENEYFTCLNERPICSR